MGCKNVVTVTDREGDTLSLWGSERGVYLTSCQNTSAQGVATVRMERRDLFKLASAILEYLGEQEENND